MFKGIIGLLTTLAVVLYSELAESQCTTRYCEDHDEADLLAVVEQLQQQFSTLNLKHERLQQEFSTLNLKHERLQQEVSTTEERNQEVVGQLQRTVTELKEELANLTKLLLPGSTLDNAARSCKQILDSASNADNGVYWICASTNCTDAREVFCDMRSGGWTLIGQISTVGDIYDKWLVTNENTDILQTPVIKRGTYGCIDAVDLAVNHANEIRLSSGESDTGMGQFWVEWDLPADRDVATFWRHSVGRNVVDSATMHSVQVQSSFAPKRICYQNKYGMQQLYEGGYPCTTKYSNSYRASGNTCMTVSVSVLGVHGFRQNFYVDAPRNNTDWPNVWYDGPPFLSVWLR